MKNRHHGWLVAVFIYGYDGAAYEEFCETESDAVKVREGVYEDNIDEVECVTIDEVWYNPETGEHEAV